MLTRKTKHALRALVRLAREPPDAPVLIGDVATQRPCVGGASCEGRVVQVSRAEKKRIVK